jgi:ATP-dependent DNA ligase
MFGSTLSETARPSKGARASPGADSDGTLAFAHACRLGLEGIVAKCRGQPYRSGRCADWIKVKNQAHSNIARAELIVLAKRRQSGKARPSVAGGQRGAAADIQFQAKTCGARHVRGSLVR